jgi:NDP-sugar pyrophosphorylase family protein
MLIEDGIFSIVASYLRLAGQGKQILGFRADDYYWRDLGRVEDLQQAEQDVQHNAALQET